MYRYTLYCYSNGEDLGSSVGKVSDHRRRKFEFLAEMLEIFLCHQVQNICKAHLPHSHFTQCLMKLNILLQLISYFGLLRSR